MVVVFIMGYAAIALEHNIKINKTATALFLGVAMWVLLMCDAGVILTRDIGGRFSEFLSTHSNLLSLPKGEQFVKYIVDGQILEFVGEISEILFFLMGAMTIVEIIDQHGGFKIITNRIKTRNRVKLLWIISFVTFFLSAVLDNLTTAIVMVALLRKLIDHKHDRWLYAGMIIIAANAGGAWSPIGDVTTIMLWIKGNLTTAGMVPKLLLASIVSLLVPLIVLSFGLKGDFEASQMSIHEMEQSINPATRRERHLIFIIGIGALLFTPIFKVVTHLPPFLGMLIGLSILWMFTEIMYHRKHDLDEKEKRTVARVLKNVDVPTILFFMGILLAVDALQTSGHLTLLSQWLDKSFSNPFTPNILIGLISAVVDNVPLVAAAMGMHPAVSPEVASVAGQTSAYVVDGHFWNLLAYCAGTGGSILIIGSAAGVAVMGLEKIDFVWYIKHISILALLGYFSGVLTYFVMFG